MKTKLEMINRILAEWDPIGVGYELAIDEYRGYIPVILQFCHDKKKLINYLQNILVNEMGLEYDGRNKKYNTDIQLICDRIIQVYNNF
jgi:hypothetical protein|nr:hypothetical protein [Bacteroides intestinalis]